jgi:hypothetical protein
LISRAWDTFGTWTTTPGQPTFRPRNSRPSLQNFVTFVCFVLKKRSVPCSVPPSSAAAASVGFGRTHTPAQFSALTSRSFAFTRGFPAFSRVRRPFPSELRCLRYLLVKNSDLSGPSPVHPPSAVGLAASPTANARPSSGRLLRRFPTRRPGPDAFLSFGAVFGIIPSCGEPPAKSFPTIRPAALKRPSGSHFERPRAARCHEFENGTSFAVH